MHENPSIKAEKVDFQKPDTKHYPCAMLSHLVMLRDETF